MQHRPFLSFLSRFGADRSGAIALLFGLLLIPTLLGVGVFLDFARAMVARERLQTAIDAAALAVGASADKKLSDAEVEALANSYFDANFPPEERGHIDPLTINFDGTKVTIDGTGTVDTTLMRIAGYEDIDIAASTVVTRQQTHIEVVMALDNTGSMSGQPISDLKTAAEKLVTTLFEEEEETSDYVKIALVPFAAAVNVGAGKRDDGWIDQGVRGNRSSIHTQDFRSDSPSLFDLYAQLRDEKRSWRWRGCVRARPGDLGLNDTPPDEDEPDTLFVPYLAPDEPDESDDYDDNYSNNYIEDRFGRGDDDDDDDDDGGGGDEDDGQSEAEASCREGESEPECRQRYTGKYFDIERTDEGTGPHFNCSRRPILALTNVKSEISSGIDSMVASGSTVVPEGLAWGWRVISPGAPFTEGAAYDDGKTIKAIILLTDGQNDIGGGYNEHNGSYYNAFGFPAEGDLGDEDGDDAEQELDAKLTTLCGNVKAESIRLYTIVFRETNENIQILMRNCATRPSMYYFSPSGDQLENVFEDIAKGLNKLRIAK